MILDGDFTPEEFDKARRMEERLDAPVHVDAQVCVKAAETLDREAHYLLERADESDDDFARYYRLKADAFFEAARLVRQEARRDTFAPATFKSYRDIARELAEKVDELCEQRIARNRRIVELEAALAVYADHTNWGIVNWPDGKHVEFLTVHESPWQRAEEALASAGYVDLTLRCPVCGRRADMCFDHGDDWKKRP